MKDTAIPSRMALEEDQRIADVVRKRRPETCADHAVADEDDERLSLEDLLLSPDDEPEALNVRGILLGRSSPRGGGRQGTTPGARPRRLRLTCRTRANRG